MKDKQREKLEEMVKIRTMEYQQANALLRSILNSTEDGILVVDNQGKIMDYNQRFIEIWNIPEKILIEHSDEVALKYVLNQLWDPEKFLSKVKKLYENPFVESYDEIRFKNGRYIERFSAPHKLGNKIVGRVWSFRDVTEKKALQEELLHKATYDVITDLPNRTLLIDRLKQVIALAKRTQNFVGVLFLDLDYFKNINDNLGHLWGDKVLRVVGQRISDSIREIDTVSRIGGDEFVILLNSLNSEMDVIPIIEKIMSGIKKTLEIEERQINITASIGISVYPKDGEEEEMLIRKADIAMYNVKETGKNNYQFYTKSMDKEVLQQMKLFEELKMAFEGNQLTLFYQPLIDTKTGEIKAVEALLRWMHPEKGLILASEIIPLAEETGMIIPISEWVLKTACQQNKAWQDRGLKPVVMSVNLSSFQFRHQKLDDLLKRVLKETGLDPQYLQLELKEKVIMDNLEEVLPVINNIYDMGVHLLIDNFGSNYSSINYLRKFPFNKLKIDKSLVQDIVENQDDESIIRAIIAMSNSLKLKVVGDGAETAEQVRLLKLNKCDEIQGFIYGKPLPAENFEDYLKKEFIPIDLPPIPPPKGGESRK